jgi:hypothetical protein
VTPYIELQWISRDCCSNHIHDSSSPRKQFPSRRICIACGKDLNNYGRSNKQGVPSRRINTSPELHPRSPRFKRHVGGNIILACRVRNVALLEKRQMLRRQLQIPFAANAASKYNSDVDGNQHQKNESRASFRQKRKSFVSQWLPFSQTARITPRTERVATRTEPQH